MKHSQKKIREALAQLSMCARKQCDGCECLDRPAVLLPSDECKKRSVNNMNILADVCLDDTPEKEIERSKHATLCWTCAKCGGLCSWSKNFTPVEGWTAIPTKIQASQYMHKNNTIDSYDVYECPEFELMERLKGKKKNA